MVLTYQGFIEDFFGRLLWDSELKCVKQMIWKHVCSWMAWGHALPAQKNLHPKIESGGFWQLQNTCVHYDIIIFSGERGRHQCATLHHCMASCIPLQYLQAHNDIHCMCLYMHSRIAVCTYQSGWQHHSGWNSTAEQDSQVQWQAVQTQSNSGSGN